MSETSNNRRLRKSLQRLVGTRPQPAQGLQPAARRQPIGQSVGVGTPNNPPGQAGIASPLTEPDASARVYYPVVEVTSTDGLIIVETESIQTLEMQDANGSSVTLQFGDPDA